MRNIIGIKAVSAAAIASAIAAIALTAQAQVSVETSVSGSVGDDSNASAKSAMKAEVTSGERADAEVRSRASTTPNAALNSTLHANENSAVIRGNDRQNDKDSTTSVEASTTDREEGTPRKMTARFLGIFPVSITAHVVADADGREEIKLPWYAFLFRVMAGADANASTTASVR